MTIGGVLDAVRAELKLAGRSLLRRPGFSILAVATLGLGIGANTAIFSVVNGVLLRPLPWTDPDELITVWTAGVADPDAGRGGMSGPDVRDVAELPVFESLVGISNGRVTLTGVGEAATLEGVRVSDGLLSTFGLAPLLGRDLRAEDTGRGRPAIVVVSHAFWSERLGASPDAVGRTILLNERPYEVVGVAPPGFDFPNRSELWRPEDWNREACARACRVFWLTVGRLAEGVTLPMAEAELRRVGENFAVTYPASNAERTFNLVGLTEIVVGDVRATLWVLLGAVALVLLIACANVANLFLARATSRIPEVAVRSALGASRPRIALHVLAEGLLLATAAGVLGTFLAMSGVDSIRLLAGDTVPRMESVAVDARVLAFAALLTFVVTLLFASSPAVASARVAVSGALGGGGRSRTELPSHARFRRTLLSAEVAISVVLLVGAGLVLRSLVRMQNVRPGFETERTLRFGLSLPTTRYDEMEGYVLFYSQLEERLRLLPGVESVGSIYGAALSGDIVGGTVRIEGHPEPEPGFEVSARVRPVTPGYFATVRMTLLRGRGFAPADRMGSAPVAVVSSDFVREFFPGSDPIGQRFTVAVDLIGVGPIQWTIAGVVNDVRSSSITRDPVPEVYVPQAQFGPPYMTVVVRGDVDIDAITGVVHALDPDLPLSNIESVEQVMRDQFAPTRFNLLLLGAFAVLALTLAVTGLYGVISYLVGRRTREIGIRSALGASAPAIARMIVTQALVPILSGLAIGLAVSLAAGRFIESMLFEVRPGDPIVYIIVAPVLLLVAVTATLGPALRAARIAPLDALQGQ